jgi:hypothetical protein
MNHVARHAAAAVTLAAQANRLLEAEGEKQRIKATWKILLGVSVINRQTARRLTSHTVMAISSADKARSQPPSIPWNSQNRLMGWYLVSWM